MPIGSGKLKHRLIIQKESGANDFASPGTWQDVATVFGAIIPRRMAENVEGQQVRPRGVVDVWIRYSAYPQLDPAMRLVHGTAIFHINGIQNEDQAERFWVVEAFDTGKKTVVT